MQKTTKQFIGICSFFILAFVVLTHLFFTTRKANNLFDSKSVSGYILREDFIEANKYKDYNLKIWINNEDILYKKNNHFHGKILVKITKKY